MFSSEGFSTHMTCGLKVDTRCKGWDRTMSKILRKIRGVSYDLDAEEGMIYISGKVDPQKILRKISKYGKHAELCWMRTGDQNIYGNNHVIMDERAYVPYGGMPMTPSPYGRTLPYHGGHHPYNPYEPLPRPLPLPLRPPLPLPPSSYYLPQCSNYY